MSTTCGQGLFLDVVAVALLLRVLDWLEIRVPWRVVVLCIGLYAVVIAAVWWQLNQVQSLVVTANRAGMLVALLTILGIAELCRRRALLGAVGLLAAVVIVSGSVNPLTRGVYDLRETEAGQAVQQIVAQQPEARWVNVGSLLPMAVAFESGATLYSGVKTYPVDDMWADIDPSGQYEQQGNRLAHMRWELGEGELRVSNSQADVALVAFDSCSAFARSMFNICSVTSKSIKDVSRFASSSCRDRQHCIFTRCTVANDRKCCT